MEHAEMVAVIPKELIVGKVRGLNTDKLDVDAGMRELSDPVAIMGFAELMS